MTQSERTIARSVLLVAAVGTFLAQLDGTVMNVALPTLSRSFHAPRLSTVQPVITAYLVVGVSLLPLVGKVADRYGRKRSFLSGFMLFGLASLLAPYSGSLGELLGLRIVQAIGGALLSGTSLALVAGGSGHHRGASLGRLSVVFALSGLLGPPVGGALVQAFGWPSIFWLNVPLCAAGLLLALRVLPADRPAAVTGALDVTGALLFAAGTGVISAGVAAAEGGWSVAIGRYAIGWPVLIVLGALAYAALLWRESDARRRGVDPLFNLPLLRTRAYGLGLVLAAIGNGVSVALFVIVPFWLAKGWHVGAGGQGAIFVPVALGLGGLAPLAGRRSDVIGARLLTTGGMIAGAIAALLLAWQATHLIWPVLVIAMFLLGAAGGLFAAPNNNAVLAAAPSAELAMASSMLSAARTLGVILGIGAFGAAFDVLRVTTGANPAARLIFLLAGGLLALNAVLCWTLRAPTPAPARAQPAAERSAEEASQRMASPAPGRLREARKPR
ncbi:MAG TPA: MFS transporter [Chloroflexota bacterium]|nr:MFS transporter [Chloroflexota bacterium]